jgi:hypothetical protein
MSVPARLWFFATIVYSGEITDVQRLVFHDTREQQLPFDGDTSAYSTVIYIELKLSAATSSDKSVRYTRLWHL